MGLNLTNNPRESPCPFVLFFQISTPLKILVFSFQRSVSLFFCLFGDSIIILHASSASSIIRSDSSFHRFRTLRAVSMYTSPSFAPLFIFILFHSFAATTAQWGLLVGVILQITVTFSLGPNLPREILVPVGAVLLVAVLLAVELLLVEEVPPVEAVVVELSALRPLHRLQWLSLKIKRPNLILQFPPSQKNMCTSVRTCKCYMNSDSRFF